MEKYTYNKWTIKQVEAFLHCRVCGPKNEHAPVCIHVNKPISEVVSTQLIYGWISNEN